MRCAFARGTNLAGAMKGGNMKKDKKGRDEKKSQRRTVQRGLPAVYPGFFRRRVDTRHRESVRIHPRSHLLLCRHETSPLQASDGVLLAGETEHRQPVAVGRQRCPASAGGSQPSWPYRA